MNEKRILGIVAEYNPFHFGHEYQIEMAKTMYKCQSTVAVMSGNYVQRGEPAIVDKYTRAETAVENGVDLVIELPLPYSCQNAELFAYGAIKELKKLNVTAISFGCESNDINILNNIAKLQLNNSETYKTTLKSNIAKGLSYPLAINETINSLLNLNECNYLTPNNILAIEYIKAASKLDYNVEFIPIKRYMVEHNSSDIKNNYASATAIRNEVIMNKVAKIKKTLPKSSYEQLKFFNSSFGGYNNVENYTQLLYYKIICLGKSGLKNIYDVNEGLENKIYENAGKYNTTNEFILSIKSKRYTYSRISRILLNILLDITYDDINNLLIKDSNYVKALAFNSRGQEVLASARDSDIPIITKYSDYKRYKIDIENDYTFKLTKRSTDIYYVPFKHSGKLTEYECMQNVIIVK